MHPYSGLPEHHFWKNAISNTPWQSVQFLTHTKFKVLADDRIATAGSCFAQNISRFLRTIGRDIYIAEPAHPLMPDDAAQALHYKQFSARYGNIYTVRQLSELLLQATDKREIINDFAIENGGVYDLLRPSIQPDGFSSIEEARADRVFHIQSVRKLFETADVFIFTLGLTEAWINTEHNFVYPACPGTVHGQFDKNKHMPANFTFNEITTDLINFINGLLEINPHIKIILTVSPVSLAATFEDQNVLVATSYSKSVLRAVCGEVRNMFSNVEYFPAFEIITSACSFGQYLDSNLRDVTLRGITHVMSCFFDSFYPDKVAVQVDDIQNNSKKASEEYAKLAKSVVDAECDELLNDPTA